MSRSVEDLLVDQEFIFIARRILAGHCSLFLGAGASISSGAPSSQELADLITNSLLMSTASYSLADAVAYADATAGRRAVADILVKRFTGLVPSASVLALTRVAWRGIFTTNIDELIETAYDSTPSTRFRELDVHIGATRLDDMRPNRTPCYLMHGSIKFPTDVVLTRDDYIKARSHQTALYRKLAESILDSEVLYIGFSLNDTDFQDVVTDVWDSVDNKPQLVPRGYALIPDVEHFVQKVWDTKKITLIDSTWRILSKR
jgi:hypothetical protein